MMHDTAPLEPRSFRVAVDGAQLAGMQAGTGTPPVVLLHGGASNRRWWDSVARLLSGKRRVVWWDHRGHGASSDSSLDCTIEQLADDTLVVLDELELGPVALVGHSLGAAVALAAAARGGPEQVSAVVCVEGGVYEPRLVFGASWDTAQQRLCPPRRPVTRATLEAWLPTAGLPTEALEAVLGNFTASGDRLTMRLDEQRQRQVAKSLWSQDLSAVLPAIHVPVGVVAADDGDATAIDARRISTERARKLLAGPLTESWVAGGHDLPLQRPVTVAEQIEQVLSADRRTHALAHG